MKKKIIFYKLFTCFSAIVYNFFMKIKKIKLKTYRNIDEIDIELNPQKNLIIGKNAQGKTNILESIYFLSKLKTPRTSNNQELIMFNKNEFEIGMQIKKNNTEIELDFSLTDEKKKKIRVNKVNSSIKDFKSILKCVLFSVNDLALLRGCPQDRRDWLDRAISQVYPAYDDRLFKYEKTRMQKNNLLKNEIINQVLLDVYNEQMVILGSNIIYLRKKYLKEIEKLAKLKHLNISENEDFSLFYESSFELADEIEEIAENFKQALTEAKQEEIRRCQSIVGPHRDDVIFFVNKKEATKYASQGQQRTIVLVLKLSELDILTEKSGNSPILLLDDVLAELDDLRQNYLLKSIKKDTQTIITSVDTLLFDETFLNDVKIFQISNGKII